jgi:hypothetical protein
MRRSMAGAGGFGERIQRPMRELPDKQNQAPRGLWARREQLIEMLAMEENRLEHAPKALHRSPAGPYRFIWPNRSNRPITTWIARCATRLSGTHMNC